MPIVRQIKMGDRFHRAAVDGVLEILKEATKADCNRPNEDGASPTHVAAYHGNVDSLRILISRGGDPNRADFTGNTALHSAAMNGHQHCLVLLVKMGANIWKLDNDYSLPLDLAALNGRDACVRFLDTVATRQRKMDPKMVDRMEQKAIRDADKRIVKRNKILDKRERKMAEEQKRKEKLESKRSKTKQRPASSQMNGTPVSLETQRTNQIFESNNHTDFSTVTQPRKTLKSKIERTIQSRKNTPSSTAQKSGFGTLRQRGQGSVGTINSEILLFGSQSENDNNDNRPSGGGDCGKFDAQSRAESMPSGTMPRNDSGIESIGRGGTAFGVDRAGLFGFNQMMFLSRSSHTLSQFQADDSDDDDDFSSTTDDSEIFEVGMAAAEFNRKQKSKTKSRQGNGVARLGVNDAMTELRPSTSLCNFNVEEDEEETPLDGFLAMNGVRDYGKVFKDECIDLEALMLLCDSDMKEIHIPLGPRRKIMDAINKRKLAQRKRSKSFSTCL